MNVLNLEQGQEWQNLLNKMPQTDVFYQPGYCRALETINLGKANLFVHKSQSNLALHPFFIQEIPFHNYGKERLFDISSPYGYNGPIFAQAPSLAERASFLDDFHNYCQENKIISEFIRFHPLEENHRSFFNHMNILKAGEIINLDLTKGMEIIWRQYARNNRKNIKKALRSDLEVIFDHEGTFFEEFYHIYLSTMDRNQASSFYYFPREFFISLMKELKGNFLFIHIFNNKTMVSTELVLHSPNYIHSFLGGTLEEFFPLRPNNLLKHKLISWAVENGFKNYLLGGGYRPGDGIFQYKLSFAPTGIKNFFVGRQVHETNTYARLCQELNYSPGQEPDYFPGYRRP